MNYPIPVILLLFFALAGALPAQDSNVGNSGRPSAAAASACGPAWNAGFRIYTFSNGRKAAVWYPSTGAESVYNYGAGFSSTLAKDAPLPACSGEKFPLVVFSHGFGGCGIQSPQITEALARNGYIVVGPDHLDATCAVDQPLGPRGERPEPELTFLRPAEWTDQNYVNRRDDVRRALDEMLSDEAFGPRIDAGKIGLSGHSLGGYTSGATAGGWSSWMDSRVKAVLLFSPFVHPFVANDTMSQVRIPVMFQSGTRDFAVAQAIKRDGKAYDMVPGSKYYVEFAGAAHSEWSIKACVGHRTIEGCVEQERSVDLINRYGLAFLNQYLKGLDQPLLTARPAVGVTEFRHIP